MIVVVGDALLDRDVTGRVDRLCPEAPVPVLDVLESADRPGGAGLAALLAAADGHEVVLVTAVADDAAGWRLRELLTAAGVRLCPVGYRGSTAEKIRLAAAEQLLLRVDLGGSGAHGRVPGSAARFLRAASAVLVSDYGHGITGLPALRRLLAERAGRCPVVWDPHPRGAPPVRGVTLITPNHAEAARFCAASGCGPGTVCVARHAEELCRRWSSTAASVTLGAGGALLWYAGRCVLVPAPTVAGGDSCGAGDRFAATVVGALTRVPSGAASLPAALPAAVEAGVRAASGYVAAGGPRGLDSLDRSGPAVVMAMPRARSLGPDAPHPWPLGPGTAAAPVRGERSDDAIA